MNFNRNQVKQYPNAVQGLVFGYVRDIYAHTPDLVLYTILAFYYSQSFDKYPKTKVNVSDQGMTITHLTTEGYNTSYGKNKVVSKYGGSVRWTIMINHIRQSCVIRIEEGRNNVDECFWNSTKSAHYALAVGDGLIHHLCANRASCNQISSWRPFCSPCTDGDTVCMELDIDRNTLSFGINGGEMRIAFTEIKPTEIGYSLAVYMLSANDSVSIIPNI